MNAPGTWLFRYWLWPRVFLGALSWVEPKFAVLSLALIPIEDALGLPDQPNLPGTIDEHPNWRRRYDVPAESMLDAPQVQERIRGLRESRR